MIDNNNEISAAVLLILCLKEKIIIWYFMEFDTLYTNKNTYTVFLSNQFISTYHFTIFKSQRRSQL